LVSTRGPEYPLVDHDTHVRDCRDWSQPRYRHLQLKVEVITVPQFRLDVGDAIELVEILQFLSDWLNSDPERLNASLTRFVIVIGWIEVQPDPSVSAGNAPYLARKLA
jgi:hypothetical protein